MSWWEWLLIWLPLALAAGTVIGKGIKKADEAEGTD